MANKLDPMNYQSEFGMLRDLRNIGFHQGQTGSQTFISGRMWHWPVNPLARMIDVRQYINTQLSRIPHEMRTNK